MDTKFTDRDIVGWYHSHPNFGIFLSDRDCFIQDHFFNGPGQIAYVVDPVNGVEGVFAWRNGQGQALSAFLGRRRDPSLVAGGGPQASSSLARWPAAAVPPKPEALPPISSA